MQERFLVMTTGQGLDVICQGKAVHTVEIHDKRFGDSGPADERISLVRRTEKSR